MKNLNQIIQDIRNWNNARNSALLMENYLSQGNSFLLNVNNNISQPEEYIHSYPAISNGSLVFYSILSKYDNQETFESHEGITPYIYESPVKSSAIPYVPSSSEISIPQAIQRIENWSNHYQVWIPNQIGKPAGMYQAFTTPAEDIATGIDHIAFFALKQDTTQTTIYTADLIIDDRSKTDKLVMEEFEDMVRPVPPFGSHSATEKEAFFLLNHALEPAVLS